MTEKIDPGFWKNIRKISKKLAEEDNVLVVSHHDADGITACAIIVNLFKKLGKDVDFKIIRQLDSITIDEVNGSGRTLIFTDMGSGQISLLRSRGIDKFYILDHHPPETDYENQVNPHFYGYDGGIDISGAGVTYLVAKSLDNEDMGHLAIIGAVGDMQDSDGKLHSLNRIIMYDGVKNKQVKVKNDLRLFGRQSRPLPHMLAYSSDPFLPGLTGNLDACIQFIQSLGISLKKDDNSWKTYINLTFEERKKLTTALYIHLLDCNIPEFIIQSMIGEVYTLLNEKKGTELRDAKEFSTLLNACGRQNESEIGVHVCLGDRERYLDKARDILQRHRQMLRNGIELLSKKGIEELPNLYFFDANNEIDENIIGVIAGMAYGAQIVPPDKPILAFAEDKNDSKFVKVSARANWSLVRRGIHLGEAMRICSSKFGGEGGGHDIAAGARVPKDKKDEFLNIVNDTFKKQLNS
ncbi:MAG TPA: DHH family phosphoesterase [Candidatus Altiarchaeales archaeon]|nr:DHH family phosphoesterase [Candidatus Altiarchaeales archaeon]